MQLVTPTIDVESTNASAEHFAATSSLSRQLVLIGRFGAFAFPEDDTDVVLRAACWAAAEGIGAGFARVLQLRPEEHAFVELAGVPPADDGTPC